MTVARQDARPAHNSDSAQRGETAAQAEVRSAVLRVAGRLFAENGFKATNLRLVADELHVTRQALYYHFRNKSDILAALFDKVISAMEYATAAAERIDGEPRLVSLLRAHVSVIIETPDLVSVLLHERPEIAKISEIDAASRRRAYTQQFVEAYEEGRRDGVLPDVDPRIAANTLLAAANGISGWYHPGRSTLAPAVVSENVLNLLLGGMYQHPRAASANANPVKHLPVA